MKIKTLKDIRSYKGSIERDKVKAEAVKWVKDRASQDCQLLTDDWVNFFNITSEDLK